jgi:hypothetical protein
VLLRRCTSYGLHGEIWCCYCSLRATTFCGQAWQGARSTFLFRSIIETSAWPLSCLYPAPSLCSPVGGTYAAGYHAASADTFQQQRLGSSSPGRPLAAARNALVNVVFECNRKHGGITV